MSSALRPAPALLWLMRRYQQGHLALGAEQTRFGVPLRRFYGVALKALGLLMLFADSDAYEEAGFEQFLASLE